MKKKWTFVFLIILFIAAFYSRMVVTEYIVHTDKWNTGESLRIVLLTDLHSRKYAEGQDRFAALIWAQKPDLIALSGDIIDDRLPMEGAFSFIEKIEKCAPIFYVTGNHECCRSDLKEIKKKLKKHSVIVLDDEQMIAIVKDKKICIAGIEDPCIREMGVSKRTWEKSKENLFKNKGELFSILLSHRPELFSLYDTWNFDLVLCGHTHGGKVRIPGVINGLWAIDQGWFPKYAGGLYLQEGKAGNYAQVVSRGCSVNLNAPRIFNPPEIVVINVIGK